MTKRDYRATLAKRRSDVAEMFDTVAARYDVMNDLMALGQNRRWRADVVEAVNPQPGQVILDLAAGTGTSSEPLAEAGATVICTDLSLGMLTVGHERRPWLPFVAGDALALPYADDSFDAVTISFGLRNVTDTSAALAEMFRVTKPGGSVVVCEFSTPAWGPFRAVYRAYLALALRVLARVASSNAPAYDYLRESILAWPNQKVLARLLAEVGWGDVEWRNLALGIVALHRGVKPTGPMGGDAG